MRSPNAFRSRQQVFTAQRAQTTRKYTRTIDLSGRKKMLTPEHEALILRAIEELREQEGSLSSLRLMERAGIRHVTDRTVRRLLNRNGYFFLQALKKGLMSQRQREKSRIC